VFIVPSHPYRASDIDGASVTVNGIPVQHAGLGLWGFVFRAKVPRAQLNATLEEGWNHVVVAGSIDGKKCFEKVVPVYAKHHKAHLAVGDGAIPGTSAELTWTTPEESPVSRVTILSTFDDGATWNVVANRIPNTESYTWQVPSISTQKARLSIVYMNEQDAQGPVNETEIAETGTFAILNGVLGVGDADAAFALRQVVPNPTRGSFNVVFSVPNASPASLRVFDVSGRQVIEQQLTLGAGTHTVGIRSGALRPGVYMVKVAQGLKSATSRVLVIQ
jgi:hypothetical protein